MQDQVPHPAAANRDHHHHPDPVHLIPSDDDDGHSTGQKGKMHTCMFFDAGDDGYHHSGNRAKRTRRTNHASSRSLTMSSWANAPPPCINQSAAAAAAAAAAAGPPSPEELAATSVPSGRRDDQLLIWIGQKHVVLRLTTVDNKPMMIGWRGSARTNHKCLQETKATGTLHQVLREHHYHMQHNADGNCSTTTTKINFGAVWETVQQSIREDNPALPRDAELLLLECTPENLAKQWVSQETHCWAGRGDDDDNQDSQLPYGVVVAAPTVVLEYYYSHVWLHRIPSNDTERRQWVADIEDQFCAWQLTPVAQYHQFQQYNQTMEDLRMAIDFVKKAFYMSKCHPGTPLAVTAAMIPEHLEIMQEAWKKCQQMTIPTTQAEIQAQMQAAHAPRMIIQTLPYPRECFQTLPTSRETRREYVERLEHNYSLWKNTVVAQQFRKNILLSFEKMLEHTTEWLEKDNVPEKTLATFLRLLQERWNEFSDKSEKYAPVLLQQSQHKRDGSDANKESGSVVAKKAKLGIPTVASEIDSTVAVASQTGILVLEKEDAKPAGRADYFIVPPDCVRCSVEDKDEDDDKSEYSQVSLPFASLIDPNPLASDATKGLFRAVESNDVDQVEHFFAQGARPNGRDEFGETPLHRAAAVGNLYILDYLRLWGADPRIRNSAGELAIHIAAWYGHAQAVVLLLKQIGPDVMLGDSEGRTPLHDACWQGHITVVRALVDLFPHKLVWQAIDNHRLSPRHYALMGGHDEVVRFLDELGVSDDKDFDPTSLHDACATGRLGLLQWMVESSMYKTDWMTLKDKLGRTPLDCARQYGHEHVMKWIAGCS